MLLFGQERRERNVRGRGHSHSRRRGRRFFDQNEIRLTAADELGINLGQ